MPKKTRATMDEERSEENDEQAIREMIATRKRKSGRSKDAKKKRSKKQKAAAVPGPFEPVVAGEMGSGFGSALENILSAETKSGVTPILQDNKKMLNLYKSDMQKRKNELKAVEERKILRKRCHTVPEKLMDEDEKRLLRIARKGVVQLFNMVRAKQTPASVSTPDARKASEKARVQAETLTKRKFMELMKQTTARADGGIGGLGHASTARSTIKQEDSTWDVLQENFGLGATLKDWDAEEEEEVQGSMGNPESLLI